MVYSGLWRWSIFRTTKRGRGAEYGYYKQVAAAADYLGYTGVLLPTGQGCEDPWC